MFKNSIIAVLITSYNRKIVTLRCIEYLKMFNLPGDIKLDIYLVDDKSTDNTGNAIKNSFPDVNVIQGNGNLFWNRGMHLAWKTASKTKKYDYFLWLNDDVLLFQNTISELLNTSVSLDNKAIITGQTISKDNNMVTYGGRVMAENGKLLTPNGVIQKCDYCNGNVVLVPKYVFEKIGMNDPIFHHTGGDDDYSLRAKRQGLSTYIIGVAVGYCEQNDILPLWCNKNAPFIMRVKNLYSPLSYSHPLEHLIFDLRHRGILYAISHQLKIFIRLMLPSLWKF